MRVPIWLSPTASLAVMLLAPQVVGLHSALAAGPAVAGIELAKECVDAGIKTKPECDAFLKKAAAPVENPAPAASAKGGPAPAASRRRATFPALPDRG